MQQRTLTFLQKGCHNINRPLMFTLLFVSDVLLTSRTILIREQLAINTRLSCIVLTGFKGSTHHVILLVYDSFVLEFQPTKCYLTYLW